MDQYGIFRLCPSNSCGSTSNYGWTGDYGEYMLPIEDWLVIIAEYREEELGRYCDYCEKCYGDNNYNNNIINADQDDGNANQEDVNNNQDDGGGRRLDNQDDTFAEENWTAEEDSYANSYCCLCTGYANMCNDDKAYDYSNLFGCVAYEVLDDLVLYIGPHWASDKSAIVLTLFNDEYCAS